MRHASFLRRLSDAARTFIDNHIVMRRISTQKTADANDGIVGPGCGKCARRRGDFKRPWHSDHVNIFFLRSGAQQPVASTLQKPFSNERIKAGYNQRKALSGSVEISLKRRNRRRGHRLNLELVMSPSDIGALCGEVTYP